MQALVPVLRGRCPAGQQVLAHALPGVEALELPHRPVEQLARVAFQLIGFGRRRFFLVVAGEHDVGRLVDQAQALARVGPVVDGVSQRDEQVGPRRVDVSEHRRERLEVGVDV